MDLKTDFETYWALFKPDAHFENRMDATRIEWDACAPDKQQAIIAWLRKHGTYKGRNPYFFIQDFRVRQPKQHQIEVRNQAVVDDYFVLRDKGASAHEAREVVATKHGIKPERVYCIVKWFFNQARKRRKYDFLQKFAPLEEH